MNGPHDMGGMTGFGPINPEIGEPVFHSRWEARVYALVRSMSRAAAWKSNRAYRESLPALKYWSSSYYEIWFEALVRALLAHGLVTESELAAGRSQGPARKVAGVMRSAEVAASLARGSPEDRPSGAGQAFAPGDKVRIRNINPETHTRLPRYARGRLGEIAHVHGTFVYPDSNVLGLGEDPQWLYTVRVSAGELWGKETGCPVYLDLWEPYLESA